MQYEVSIERRNSQKIHRSIYNYSIAQNFNSVIFLPLAVCVQNIFTV